MTARKPADLSQAKIHVEPVVVTGPSVLYRVKKNEAVEVPEGIRAHVEGDGFDVWVELGFTDDNEPCVKRCTLQGERIASEALRAVGLRDIAREVVKRAAWRLRSPEGSFSYSDAAVVDAEPATGIEVDRIFRTRRGPRVDPGEVERAAAAYRQALAEGRRDPLMATAAAIGWSRATAARRIKAARVRGLLGEDD